MPSTFANLLETVFCGFGKNPRMPSPFSKLLELLLARYGLSRDSDQTPPIVCNYFGRCDLHEPHMS
jgi:hypothetical protein